MDPVDASFGQNLAWRLEAVGYGAVKFLLRLLPVDAASDLGAWILSQLGPLTGVDKTVRRNLRLAFPEMSEAERERIRRAQWESVGRYFAEFLMMDRLTLDSGRVEVVGMERLKAIAEHGPATVFVSGHLSNFEIMSSVILGAGIDCAITFRKANNPYVNEAIVESRKAYGVELFAPKSSDGIREMLQAMGRGQSVALMNDQKNNRGVASLFFGQPVHTATGPAKLALRFGGQIQPMSVQRLKGARFRVIVHEPIPLPQTGDRQEDVEVAVRRITDFIEARVRERPEEYFWVHKRWDEEAYARLGM
ncbi:lysophospholipid acyltransferase family protein [Phenylobacterium montanum]|uniref:Lysophospholipid acyltransferase family protein n=1 Tax=Phenylobacterium montanum TaxID=2823693 RepID=A0A975FX24_9CAUL|nr:lysophospholipid acyltransferase family protein [Caulobacter sp. S6]QUD86393.1 lysophospholipid acyltransferase family protein [Caulobacter sp. S6]